MSDTKATLTDEQIAALTAFGVSKIPDINEATLNYHKLRKLSDEQIAIVFICYSASLCKLTNLNLHDTLQLMLSAYNHVEIECPEKPNAPLLDQN